MNDTTVDSKLLLTINDIATLAERAVNLDNGWLKVRVARYLKVLRGADIIVKVVE